MIDHTEKLNRVGNSMKNFKESFQDFISTQLIKKRKQQEASLTPLGMRFLSNSRIKIFDP
jgi:predicted CopG family antitoxin